MLETFRADLARYDGELGGSRWRRVLAVAETQGIWALAVYRFGRWVYTRAPLSLAVPLKAAYHVGQKAVEIATGIQIPASCDIGPGLYIGHFGTIIVHTDVRMGHGCSIGQDTTLGTVGRGHQGAPVLGDGVYVGSGARVLGPVHLGDGAVIGANAVVLHDVPAGATAVGVPARVVPRRAHAAAPSAPARRDGGRAAAPQALTLVRPSGPGGNGARG